MPTKSRSLLPALSLIAAMGPIHRSSFRFDKPAGEQSEKETPSPEPAEKGEAKVTLTPLARLKAALGAKQDLAQQLADARGVITTRESELAQERAKSTDLATKLSTAQARVTALEAEHAEFEALALQAEEKIKNVDKIASAKAAAIAGGQGIPERDLPAMKGEGQSAAASDKKARSAELLKEYQRLCTEDPSKAAAFYQANEKEMLA